MPWIQFTRRSVIAYGDSQESSTDYAAVAGQLSQNVTITTVSLITQCQEAGNRMLNLPLPETAAAPDWIELIPAGSIIVGADGRQWLNDTPDRIVAAFIARNKPMVVDYEHASEHRAPVGLDAPAAGWIDRIEIRDGAVWGRVEWTAQARQRIQAREYRFISPVFTFEKASSRIVALQSAALTNQPNLNLTALNSNNGDWMTARCRQEFADNAGIRAEFGDVETLIAYRRAVANGVTIERGKTRA